MKRATAIVCIAAALGCADALVPWSERLIPGTPPLHTLEWTETLNLSARVSPTSERGAVTAQIILHNPHYDSVEVTFGACSFALWVYGDRQEEGPPVWDGGRRDVACRDMANVLGLAPGESHELDADVAGGNILGDSMPAGRYRFYIAVKHTPNERITILPAGRGLLR